MSTFQSEDLLTKVKTQALPANILNYDKKQPNIKISGKYQSFMLSILNIKSGFFTFHLFLCEIFLISLSKLVYLKV